MEPIRVNPKPAGPAGAMGPLEDDTERVVEPRKRRLRVRDLPRQREVIAVLAARDFRVKYKQSVLGPLWLVFQPFALLVAFLVAFRGLGDVQTSQVPYVVFALVGLAAWAFFQACMGLGTSSVITNNNFVRYTPCPRSAFPLAAVIASLPSFAVTGAAAVVGAAVTGHLSARVLLLPLGVVWLFVLTLGIVLVVSALAVKYRDVISAMPFLLQVSVFLVPVGYGLDKLSPTVRALVEINPLTGLIEAWRWMVLQGYQPATLPIAISLCLTVVVGMFGWRTFARLETTMADEI